MTIKSKKAHWEKIYTDLLPEEVSWYQKEPTLSLELIRRAGLGPDGETSISAVAHRSLWMVYWLPGTGT